jgi:hypothetical protein
MESRTLSGREVRALLTNARVEGKHEVKGYAFVREYGERSFKQLSPDGAEATWSANGNQVCIRWKSQSKNLCRSVRTNDRGDYWKVLIKRRGGTKTVVSYSKITDLETGADRRVFGNPLIIVMRLVFSRAGWVVMIGLLIVYAWWKGQQPTPIVIAGKSYLPDELLALPIDELEAHFQTLLGAKSYSDARRVFEIMRTAVGSHSQSWSRIWTHVAALPDGDAIAALSHLLQAPAIFPKSLLDSVKEDSRAVYLIGRGYSTWAESVRRLHDATDFNRAREGGMLFLDYLREDSGAPVPDPSKEAEAEKAAETVGSAVQDGVQLKDPSKVEAGKKDSESKIVITKGDLALDYVALAAGAYETVMYLQHDPPAYTSSSSSYSGGGGG